MFSQRIDFFFFSNRIFLPNRNAKANTQKQHSHIVILSILRQKPIHKFCNAFETILSLCRRFIKLSAHPLAKPLVQTGHHRRYMSDCGIYQTWPLTLSGLSVFAGQVQLAVCVCPSSWSTTFGPAPLCTKPGLRLPRYSPFCCNFSTILQSCPTCNDNHLTPFFDLQ